MALTADRITALRTNYLFEGPMAASVECFVGALLVRDASGNVKPGATGTGLIACGICDEYAIESTGVAAASNVKYVTGCAKLKNSATDPITKASIGDTVYIEDDETVCATATGKSAAGIMVDIESDGVWLRVGADLMGTVGLLAANNLSDVGSAATARTNLGLGTANTPTFADVTATDDVFVGDDLAVTGLATIGETLGVTGITTLSGLLNANAGIAVDTTAFTVAGDGTGNTAVGGTLTVTGQLNANAGVRIAATAPVRKFVRKSLTATQIRKLFATPVQILAAVAGHAFVPLSVLYKYTHVANVYDSVGAGEDFRVQWKTGAVAALQDLDTTTDINLGGAASDQCHIQQIAKSQAITNSDLEVTVLTAELAAADADVNGDGTMVMDLVYDDYTV